MSQTTQNMIKGQVSVPDPSYALEVAVNEAQKLTEWFQMAKNGQVEAVEGILKKDKTRINIVDGFGMTALHYASKSGHEKFIELLIDNEADTTLLDDEEMTALELAARVGSEKVVNMLLQRYKDGDAGEGDKKARLNASSKAIDNGYYGLAMKILGKLTFDATESQKFVRVARDLVEREESGETKLQEKNDMLQIILQKFPQQRPPPLCDVLQLAIRSKNAEAVRLILTNDLCRECFVKGADGTATQLHIAAQYGEERIMRMLLEECAKKNLSVDVTDSKGRTALHVAAQNKQDKIVSQLLENKSSYDCNDKGEETPLHKAARVGSTEVVQSLLKPLTTQRREADERSAQAGADSKGVVSAKTTETERDIQEKQPSPLQTLGNWRRSRSRIGGAVKNLVNQPQNDRTPSINNAEKKMPKQIIKSYLFRGNVDGMTALHLAAKYGRTEVVQLLLVLAEHLGFNDEMIKKFDRGGQEPLLYAIKKGRLETVKLLYPKPPGTRELLIMAANQGQLDILRYLYDSSYASLVEEFRKILRLKGLEKDSVKKFIASLLNA